VTYVVDTSELLAVSEVFETWQGEGPSLGRRCSFVRLGGCNLHCTWCDTAYTWDAARYNLREQITMRPVDDVLDQVRDHLTSMVVITGGEPLLHQYRPGFITATRRLYDLGYTVEVETNGTRPPSEHVATCVSRFNVSPKLAHAGDPEAARIRPQVLTELMTTGKAVFKFVVSDPAQLAEVTGICARAGIPASLVWIMPEGTDGDTLLRRGRLLAPAVRRAGYNFTNRLHVLLWGDTRGR
jgi:7-carboxy-7-deazaguanine synthase